MDLLDLPPRIVQQMELLKTVVAKKEHRSYPVWCARCSKIHHHPFPENVAREELFKERPTALAAYMKAVGHASFSTIRKFIHDIKHLARLRDAEMKAYGRKLLSAVKAMFKIIHEHEGMDPAAFGSAMKQARETIMEAAPDNVPPGLDKNGKEPKRSRALVASGIHLTPPEALPHQRIRTPCGYCAAPHRFRPANGYNRRKSRAWKPARSAGCTVRFLASTAETRGALQ